MHPMFVELYLQADADQDEQDRRRRAARSRRLRSRTALRVVTTAVNSTGGAFSLTVRATSTCVGL